MSALTCDKMPYYAEKIDTMLNEAYTRFTVNHEPVLSTFKQCLIRFFLNIHIGEDNYPDYVIEYFSTFIDIIGFGDPQRPGRNEAMVRGNYLAPRVKAYFEERKIIVVQNKDKSCIAYYWNEAGLPSQSLLIECVHNIVAFSQYNNTLYRLIADKLWKSDPYPYPPPPSNPPPFGGPPPSRGTVPYWYPMPPIPLKIAIPPLYDVGPVDFFDKLANAPTADDKLNVVREVYRLLAPNTNAFSKLETGNVNDPPTQNRLIWQQVMILNQTVPALPSPPYPDQNTLKTLSFFSYNPDQYNADFKTSVLGGCNPAPAPLPEENFNPADLFEISPTDNDPVYDDGTVLEKSNPKLFPVFDKPLYLPFGMGYRRCAGETLNMFFTEKMIARFADLSFEVRELPSPPDYTLYQTLGPFTAVPNNIYTM
jgi:hypothetical protein